MDRKKLERLWRDLKAAWRLRLTESDLVELAKRCGRKKLAGGNHPMWISPFPAHRAFPISHHGGNPYVSPHVQKVVLTLLEADAEAWEQVLENEERRGGANGDGNGSG